MDQDLRDEAISTSTDITIWWFEHAPITINIQSNWPLQFVRHEILLLCNDLEERFYFKLDGRKVRNMNETKIKCGDCASLHVLSLLYLDTSIKKSFGSPIVYNVYFSAYF